MLLIPNSTLATVTGTLSLDKSIYRSGETLYIQVTDIDENEDSTAEDSLSVSVASNTETTAETVTLTETGISTGVFQDSLELDDERSVVADGKLQVTFDGDKITVTYEDLADDWGNTITVVKTADFFGNAIGGDIDTGTTWTKANSPYIVTDSVFVNPGVLLSIEPGVEVKFMAGSGLFIYGTLKAIGTQNEPIRFLSNANSPAPGDWGGIKIIRQSAGGDSNITFEYCIISEGSPGILIGADSGYLFKRIDISNSSILRNKPKLWRLLHEN